MVAQFTAALARALTHGLFPRVRARRFWWLLLLFSLQVLFELISSATYEFHAEFWGDISAAAKDLIAKLLVVNPAKRMTVGTAELVCVWHNCICRIAHQTHTTHRLVAPAA